MYIVIALRNRHFQIFLLLASECDTIRMGTLEVALHIFVAVRLGKLEQAIIYALAILKCYLEIYVTFQHCCDLYAELLVIGPIISNAISCIYYETLIIG